MPLLVRCYWYVCEKMFLVFLSLARCYWFVFDKPFPHCAFIGAYINPRTGLDIVNALICPLFLQPAALLYDCKHPYSAEFCIRFTTLKRLAFTTTYGPLKRYACKDVI